MKYIKKIIRVIIATIIALVLAFNIYNFVNIKVLNKDLSTIFGYSTLEVVSGSMEPTIKVGDLIVIDTKAKSYKKGDIVTFYDVNGSFVTHRIVSIDDDKMITKGDNNESKDAATKTNKIVGKYVYKLAYLGVVLSFFKNPLVLILVLIIGILYSYLVSADESKEKVKKATKKKKTKKKKLSKAQKQRQEIKKLKEELDKQKQEHQNMLETKQQEIKELKDNIAKEHQEHQNILEIKQQEYKDMLDAKEQELRKHKDILEEKEQELQEYKTVFEGFKKFIGIEADKPAKTKKKRK